MNFRRHKHRPIAVRPPDRIVDQDSAESLRGLANLVIELNQTVQSLWETVQDLRKYLGAISPGAVTPETDDRRPSFWQGPPIEAGAAVRRDTFELQIDTLTGDAEHLWFESQWLRAQISIAVDNAQ